MGLCAGVAGLGFAQSDAAGDPPAPSGFARLEGHGGPIMGVSIAPNAPLAATASFDNSIGLWRLDDAAPSPRWLDGHEAAVNCAVFTADAARLVSGADDFDLILWDVASGELVRRFEGHRGKVLNVALSDDGESAASASWDGSIGLWRLDGSAPPRFLTGHGSGVNDVLFAEGGRALFSASSDGTVRKWDVESGRQIRVEARHGFGVRLLEIDEAAGWLAYGATDGVVRVLDLASGAEIASLTGDRRPILALELSDDRRLLAYGDGEGYISVVSTEDWSLLHDFRAVVRGPVWALDFAHDGRLIAGGLDDSAAIWPVGSEAEPLFDGFERRFHVDPETVSNGERQFARKCSVCHALTPDGRRRAGPTLYGVFGREAGTLPGYTYSEALTEAEFVWSPETLDKLFDLGPDHYTPGSKMPMQRIVDPADRADLIAFLSEATAVRNDDARQDDDTKDNAEEETPQ